MSNQITTKKEKQELLKETAQNNYEYILEAKNITEATFLVMGKLLTENRREGYYKILGHRTFEEFIASPEISFHRTTAYKFMKIYQEFIEYYKVTDEDLKGIDSDKLYLIISVLDRKNLKDWLEKARTLSRSDLRTAIQGKNVNSLNEPAESWVEYSDVWEKLQPISRWGKNPKQSIYGQFVANLVNYYTKKGEKVVAGGFVDTVVRDVCNELERDYEVVKEGSNLDKVGKLNGKLGIAITSSLATASDYTAVLVKLFDSLVQKGGAIAFYIKGDASNEADYSDFITAIETISIGKIIPERLIIIREKPDVKKINQAIRDEKLAYSFERIIIFRKKEDVKNT